MTFAELTTEQPESKGPANLVWVDQKSATLRQSPAPIPKCGNPNAKSGKYTALNVNFTPEAVAWEITHRAESNTSSRSTD